MATYKQGARTCTVQILPVRFCRVINTGGAAFWQRLKARTLHGTTPRLARHRLRKAAVHAQLPRLERGYLL